MVDAKWCREAMLIMRDGMTPREYMGRVDVWIRENKIDGINKDFAQLCGFTEWEKCTNHSNR